MTITDGTYAGETRDTTNDGHYRFTDLAPSTMTLKATFNDDYVPQSKTITLTGGEQSVDFILSDH